MAFDSGVSRGTAGTINFGIGLTCSEISAGDGLTAQGQTGVNTTTASAGVAYAAHSFALSDYASAEYTFTCGLGTQRQVQKLLVMPDGTTAYSSGVCNHVLTKSNLVYRRSESLE